MESVEVMDDYKILAKQRKTSWEKGIIEIDCRPPHPNHVTGLMSYNIKSIEE